jgi:plasmid stabilization system protein ParE
MRLVLHPKVYSDIDEIMRYYERVATPVLAEEFYTELRYFMAKAGDKPESFSIRERDIRRANLRRFPYHFSSVSLAAKSEFSSFATTIDIHLSDPGADRSMVELQGCRLGWPWISNADIKWFRVEILIYPSVHRSRIDVN